jgi:tRNA-specific 2-thiouridylase
MPGSKGKVVCAMSGGVDSSVAAALLKEQGYDVVGVFMRLGSPKGVEITETCDVSGKKHKQGCCSVNDAADARRVAGMLDIPFYVLNFEDDFGKVIDYFVSEYNAGRTPNPCVRCNDWLKFGKLAQYAKAVGADYVASGHYARFGTDPATGKRALMRGLDRAKDQSYVLFGMTRDAADHSLLPIGEYDKADVRKMAEERGLPVFSKPDSQEICFVPDQDYAGLLKRRSPETIKPGKIVTTDGTVVGGHEGFQSFTIGQRKGLNVALGHRIYVVDTDPRTNTVTVGDKERLFKRTLHAGQANWLSDRVKPGVEMPVLAKMRYNHDPEPATLVVTGARTFTVTFDEAQTAITPGQACVCFDGDVVLGGGWIDAAE